MKKSLLIILVLLVSKIITAQEKYDFSPVDKIIEDAIHNHAFPSAVLLVGSSKGIIYQNAYGRLTYNDDAKATSLNTIYDLASVTKVIATTAAIMKLYEENLIDINAPVASYIPEFANNNKLDITVLNLLLHNSGLTAWTPFYQDTNMTSADKVKEAIFNSIKEYPTGSKTVYSDYNAFLLGEIVERITGKKLNVYCEQNIFVPLGMSDTKFLQPTSEDYRIAPTEHDEYWRNELLIGYVHDELAAMLEGVSGNAGLFSTAQDLFKFMQMLLNEGVYIDPRKVSKDQKSIMFSGSTINLFTNRVTGLGYYNTRALGWDTKPEATKYPPQCGVKFSANCFGHTGYTGTSVWADKDKDLIIIFLTNRIYPKRGNEEIRNVRPSVHDEVCRILGY